MTDETPPQSPATPQQPERSWSPETGWPEAGSTPAWAEPPVDEGAAEDEYDAWLAAQDPTPDDEPPADAPPEDARAEEPVGAPEEAPSADQPPAELVDEPAPTVTQPQEEPVEVTAPVVVPDALEAAATPLEVEPTAERTAEPAAEPVPGPVEEAPEEPAEPLEQAEAQDEPTAAVEEPAEALEQVEAHDELTAAVEEPLPEPAEAPPAGADAVAAAVPTSRSGVPVVAPLAALVLLLAALTAFLAVWASRTSGGGAAEDARRDALTAARNASRLLFSYDYRHLDKDFAAGRAVTTGTFAKDYQRTTSTIVGDTAPRYKAVVVADVSDAAVISATASKVDVLVFLNQSSTSSLSAGQKVTQSRLTMTLERKHGTWLVSKVNAF